MIERGDWQVSEIARNAFDLEGKVVGTIGAGRIGYRVLQRLLPFDCKELLYYDYIPLPEGEITRFAPDLSHPFVYLSMPAAAKAVKARRVENLEEFVSQCDVVTVNCPLHEGTRGLVNAELLKHFKKGAWLVNTARGAICDKDAVAEAVKSGQLNGTSPRLPSCSSARADFLGGLDDQATRATSGTSNLHPRTTSGERSRTPSAVAMAWFPTTLVRRWTLRNVTPVEQEVSSKTTSVTSLRNPATSSSALESTRPRRTVSAKRRVQ